MKILLCLLLSVVSVLAQSHSIRGTPVVDTLNGIATNLTSKGAFAMQTRNTAISGSFSADQILYITASGTTQTLPTAVGITGRLYAAKLVAVGTGTIATTGGQTIDGAATFDLGAVNEFVIVRSDGANWKVEGKAATVTGSGGGNTQTTGATTSTNIPFYLDDTGTNIGPSTAIFLGSGTNFVVVGNVFGNGAAFTNNVGAGTVAPDSKLQVNVNTLAGPAPVSGTAFHVTGADSAVSRITVDSFANSAVLTLRRASGTAATQSAVADNDRLGAVGATGYGATAYGGAQNMIGFYADEAWTDTEQGTYMAFFTTLNAGVSISERMRIDNAGKIWIGPLLDTGFFRSATGVVSFADSTGTSGTGSLVISNLTANGTITSSSMTVNSIVWDDGSGNTLRIVPPNLSTDINLITDTAPGTGFWFGTVTGTTNETITHVGSSGSGNVVRVTSATLVTPTLGVAAATTINKVALTAPATGSTLTIADGKTLTVSQDTTLNRQSSTGLPVEFGIAVGDETTVITTGTAKVTFRAPYAFTVTEVRASLTTASSSGTPTFDINETGSGSILSTLLTIDANELTSTTAATPPVISDSAIADDAQITIDIDVAGTGATGPKVWIKGYR